jgi:hypothetical protein
MPAAFAARDLAARPTRPAVSRRWLPLGIVAAMALAAAVSGTDADWDLRNYHLYNAHALISGRFWTDIAPAQLQSFYTPWLDILLGVVRDRLDATPVLRNIALSLPQGVAAAFACSLTLRLLPAALPGRTAAALLATLYGATGAAGFPTLATAMSDMLPGACILGGLVLLTGTPPPGPRHAAGAGALFGCAAALKLTALPCAAAATIALLLVPPRRDARLLIAAAFALGGIAAAAAVGGPWWGLMLRQFGNPVLPYLNQWFRSPFVAPLPFADTRFLPHGVVAALAYPFLWAAQARPLVSELPLRDPRFALAWCALAIAAVPLWRARRVPAADPATRREDQVAALLAVFFAVAFVLWEALFGVLRYLATLELLTGSLLLIALRPALRRRATCLPALLGCVAVAAAAQALTVYPDWGRTGRPGPVSIRVPALPDDALLVLLDPAPMAYVATVLPAAIRLVGADNNLVQPGAPGLLAARAEAAIRAAPGPLYGLEAPREAPGIADATLAWYGLHRGDCAPVISNLDDDAIRLCRLLR